MNELILIIVQGYLMLVVLQAGLWAIQNHTKDASTADVGWAIGMSVLVGWYAVNLEGNAARKMLMGIPVLIWTIRLSSHLLRRMMHHQKEDSRYAQFRQAWGRDARRNFFMIYQLQPVFNVLLSVPFLIAFMNPDQTIKAIEIIAVMVWTIGILGESVADEQLRRFMLDPANKGKVCQLGLWNYSRHPNFFFEWLMWVAYFIFALSSPYGWWAVIAPAFMLFLLIKVTGIPLMEQRALANKGDAFREYMRTTSFFIPLPKRSIAAIV